MKISLAIILLFLVKIAFSQEEMALIKSCNNTNLPACETLGSYYIKKMDWAKGVIVGEALCAKDLAIGCTFAGTSLLGLGKGKEGNSYLTKACDKFEPYACRSLGRLMKKVGDSDLSHLYFRRACHYGLKEICSDLKRDKKILSSTGLDFLSKVKEDCADSQSSACSDRLSVLNTCTKPLSKEDCQLLPGYLSILFRAKLMQAEAKFSLTLLVAGEKALKIDPKIKAYSYDLALVLKDYKPQNYYHYVFGFMNSCSGQARSTSLSLFKDSYKNINSKSLLSIRHYFNTGKKSDCYDPAIGFEAFALASLDPLNPTRLDIWKMNYDGNLIQLMDGLPSP